MVSRLLASLICLAWHEQELDYQLCLLSLSLPNYSLCPHFQLLYSHSHRFLSKDVEKHIQVTILSQKRTLAWPSACLFLFFYLCFLLILLRKCFSIFFACVILSMLVSSSYDWLKACSWLWHKWHKLVLQSCSAHPMMQERALESRWEWKSHRIVMVWLERGRKGTWTSLRLQSKMAAPFLSTEWKLCVTEQLERKVV